MICLVAAPTVVEFDGTAASRSRIVRAAAAWPPLGILSLAAVLEQAGLAPRIIDLNRLYYRCAEESRIERDFFSVAVDELLAAKADVYGFSTICSSYPLVLRLAGRVKAARPRSTILFGGPQASAVDIPTLEAFPFVDIVVRGEAEEILPALLAGLGSPERLRDVPNIAFRDRGAVRRTPDGPVPADLDRLPEPAFHLWGEMPDTRELPLEVGRGCPFRCAFCSTSQFFGRRFRLKTPGRVIEEMKFLRLAYGIRTFHLMHDAFTVVRGKTVAFCRALLDSGGRFQWTCSTRTDCVDEELLALMAESGCTAIFFGVESGSPAVQNAIGKRLDPERALAAIRSASCHRMKTTVSLITGFPEETPADVRSTARFIFESLTVDGVGVQFHLVAPLAGTALHRRFCDRLRWDALFSDMAYQGWRQDAADLALIRQRPDIFCSFYAIPCKFLDRARLMELRDFIVYGIARFRWLMIALHRHGGDAVNVFEQWRAWRADREPRVRFDGQYYAGDAFQRDFLQFARSAYLREDDPEAAGILALLEYEECLERAEERGEPPQAALDHIPRVAPGVKILRLSFDYPYVIDCLRNRRSPRDTPRRPTVVADRLAPDGAVEVLRLTPLAAALLDLCDGARPAGEVAAALPRLIDGLSESAAGPACDFALNQLARQGLVVFTRVAGSPNAFQL